MRAARLASGVTPRVIPYEEEGRLIYLAVKGALQLEAAPALIVDIGGGSVQLVVGDRDRLLLTTGARLGALRLTETMPSSDPPSRRDLQRLRRHIRRELAPSLKALAVHRPGHVYGSSGAIHALAQAAHWADAAAPIAQINGHVLTTESIERLTRRLQRMSLAERERVPGIDSLRAEIILPGALLLTHLLRSLEAPGITLSDFGVREGLVTDYLASHAREVTTLEQVESLRLRSALALLTKFLPDPRHSQHAARLALALFDGLRAAHRLGPHEREMLHYAALLHDIGAMIGYDGHGEHSYYIIKNGNLRGLSAPEVEMVANVARYHGKARPRKRDAGYAALDKPQRRAVKWLSALLRIAEGLDRSHYQLIRGLRVQRRTGRVSILVAARRDTRLELWAARRRTSLLEELLGARVGISREKPQEGRTARAAVSAPGRARRAPPGGGGNARRPRVPPAGRR